MPRQILFAPGIRHRHALALAAGAYRSKYGGLYSGLLRDWFGWSRWKANRVLADLLEQRLLDIKGCPQLDRLPEGPAGYIPVDPKIVRADGDSEALAMGQLESWAGRGSTRLRGGQPEVPTAELAKALRVCQRTAQDLLRRLATGATVRARRLGRSLAKAAHAPRIAVERLKGRASAIRLLGERERTDTMKRNAAAKKKTAEKNSAAVPPLDQLLGMASGTRAPPATA
ncbi:MAG: hypothetical protein MO852_09955 [Candidatus Devosia euplotis]|nr:hypothetical protein [Candidatus Devosia euplotis]